MGRLGAAELSVNGAWHSIYPFYAEKQHVSRKGKISAHKLIRRPSHLLTSLASRKPFSNWHSAQIMVHRRERVFQGHHSPPGAGSNVEENAYRVAWRRERCVERTAV